MQETATVRIGYNIIEATRLYTEFCRDWWLKPAADKTAGPFMLHFNAAKQDWLKTSATAGDMYGNNVSSLSSHTPDYSVPDGTDTTVSEQSDFNDMLSAMTSAALACAAQKEELKELLLCMNATASNNSGVAKPGQRRARYTV